MLYSPTYISLSNPTLRVIRGNDEVIGTLISPNDSGAVAVFTVIDRLLVCRVGYTRAGTTHMLTQQYFNPLPTLIQNPTVASNSLSPDPVELLYLSTRSSSRSLKRCLD